MIRKINKKYLTYKKIENIILKRENNSNSIYTSNPRL